jgi:hypothetical protein
MDLLCFDLKHVFPYAMSFSKRIKGLMFVISSREVMMESSIL